MYLTLRDDITNPQEGVFNLKENEATNPVFNLTGDEVTNPVFNLRGDDIINPQARGCI